MNVVALVGMVTVWLPPRSLARIVLPMVGVAAGSLLGGAFFNMIPDAVRVLGNRIEVYAAVVIGFFTFFVLEQFLHWHHCHRVDHRDTTCVLGHLILLADGLHNFIGGLAVGGAFMVDVRIGLVAWLVAAAHEIPQELGDFGVLVHSGWTPGAALVWNVVSASTFLAGALVAYALASRLDVGYLLPFAAGNFIYIASADLVPEISAARALRTKVVTSLGLVLGLVLLFLVGRASRMQ